MIGKEFKCFGVIDFAGSCWICSSVKSLMYVCLYVLFVWDGFIDCLFCFSFFLPISLYIVTVTSCLSGSCSRRQVTCSMWPPRWATHTSKRLGKSDKNEHILLGQKMGRILLGRLIGHILVGNTVEEGKRLVGLFVLDRRFCTWG